MDVFGTPQHLVEIIDQHKAGAAIGIPSICSANRYVLQACMRQYKDIHLPLLIESTCNQVNQFGGYTGLTPEKFSAYVLNIAKETGFPRDRIILGGDHLGPFPWKNEPADIAMEKSIELVCSYVQADYKKIHVDTSMPCIDDNHDQPLPIESVAERTVQMVTAVEETRKVGGAVLPFYVIGTEVPPPGGAKVDDKCTTVTSPEDASVALVKFHEAFSSAGLQHAWERVIALVVQPGVEFTKDNVLFYDRQKARPLSKYIESVPDIVFEAHSTDYQTRLLLKQMVEDHFMILKVGPALTFAFREAIISLARIEEELFGRRKSAKLSEIIGIIEYVMDENPHYYKNHSSQSNDEEHYSRIYSFSDRVRYYWNDARVVNSVHRLITNLEKRPIPLPLLSQYMKCEYERVLDGEINNDPLELIWSHIMKVMEGYLLACGALNTNLSKF